MTNREREREWERESERGEVDLTWEESNPLVCITDSQP